MVSGLFVNLGARKAGLLADESHACNRGFQALSEGSGTGPRLKGILDIGHADQDRQGNAIGVPKTAPHRPKMMPKATIASRLMTGDSDTAQRSQR